MQSVGVDLPPEAKDRLRVLIVSPRYVPDFYGPAAPVHQVALALARRGVDVRVLTAGDRPELQLVDGVPVESVGAGRYRPSGGRTAKFLSESLRLARGLRRLRGRYDVVYILDYKYQATLLALVAYALSMKVVVRWSISRQATLDSPARRVRDAVRDRCTSMVVAVSPALHEAALATERLRGRALHVPNGVDAERFRPASGSEREELRSSLGLPVAAFVGLYVGAIHPRKAPIDLVNVWADATDGDSRAILLLVGPCRDAEYQARLRDVAMERGVADRIRLVGRREDPQDFYRAADAFLFASTREGLPNAVLEAMACGMPVVGRDIPGVHELLGERESGYLCAGQGEKAFVADMAGRIRAIRGSPAEAAARGTRARQLVLEKYSIGAMVEGHLAAFRMALSGQPG